MKRTILPLVIVGGVTCLASWLILGWNWTPRAGDAELRRGGGGRAVHEPDSIAQAPRDGPDAALVEEDATKLLAQIRSRLQATASAEQAREILGDLKGYLASIPPEVTADVIGDFLADPDLDASTRIDFKVARGGSLSGHPSLRVALLDWLGEIHPARAAEVAGSILATPTHPDEWAVCLRNYARVHEDEPGLEFLRTKTEELIRNPVWRENPSAGFLESFDVLVHARATGSATLLGELVADTTPGGKALSHAAYLTLDRLTIREPVAMFEKLASQPDLTKFRGPMVANMFARGDLRDPEQRELIRAYLLDPGRSQEELKAFAGVFPNNNYAISNNLLTDTRSPTRDELVEHDAAALQVVQQWLDDPEFEPVKTHLATMRRRLASFISQSAK